MNNPAPIVEDTSAAPAANTAAPVDNPVHPGASDNNGQQPADNAAAPGNESLLNSQANTNAEGGEQGSTQQGAMVEGYDQPFTLPDGITLDQTSLEAFTPFAKELDLSQENAQKVVDMGTDLVQRTAEAVTAQVEEQRQAEIKGWRDAAETDSEYGGDKLKDTLIAGDTGLRHIFSQESIEVLQAKGLANHPEVIRDLAKFGRTLQPDEIVNGGDAAAADPSPASVLFPTMSK